MKKTLFFVLLCIVAFATGCPKSTPVRPEVITKIAEYEMAQLDKDTANYECAANNGQIFDEKSLSYKPCGANTEKSANPRQIRNQVIYRLLRITDYNYFQFENDLYVKRASGSVLADVIDTGANLAATISNGERAKTIINASIIAFRGGRKSASIHYFQEQTADVLITKMQTARNRVLAEMLIQMRDNDIDNYPLDAALGDVIKYFYAGTLPRALQELKQDASVAAQIAKNDVLKIEGIDVNSIPTIEQEQVSKQLFTQVESLGKQIKDSENDSEASAKITLKMHSIWEQISNEPKLASFVMTLKTSDDSKKFFENEKIPKTFEGVKDKDLQLLMALLHK